MSLRSITVARAAAVVALLALLSSVAAAGSGLGIVVRRSCDPAGPAGRVALAQGEALVAGVGSAIVRRDGRDATVVADTGVPGLARHVADAPAHGTAYVLDRSGHDLVVVAGPSGVNTVAEPGEVTHPSWANDGRLVWSLGDALRLRSADGTRIRTIAPPRGAEAVFSPLFRSGSTLVAVVAEATAGPHADTSLDNLWSYDLVGETWQRLTAFGPGDRWSAIRTPVRSPAGAVEFVRVVGDATRTGTVGYQLWSWSGGRSVELRRLPEERFLAGYRGARRLWNRYDAGVDEWRLLLEGADGSLVDLGCGRVQVDPRGQADPDLWGAEAVASFDPSTPLPTSEPSTPSTTPSSPTTFTPSSSPSPTSQELPSMAILVGDFRSAAAAEEVAARIRGAYGDAAGIAVVDSALAPSAVAPGVWAVVLPVTIGSDVASALATFRATFPEYGGWSWVVAI